MVNYETEVTREGKTVTFPDRNPPKLSEVFAVVKQEFGEDFENIQLSFPVFGGFGGNYGEHLRLTRHNK